MRTWIGTNLWSRLPRPVFAVSVATIVLALLAMNLLSLGVKAQDTSDWQVDLPPVLTYTSLVEQVEAGNVTEVTIAGHQVTGTFKEVRHVVNGRAARMDEPLPDGVTTATVATAFEATVPPGAETAFVQLLTDHGVTVRAEEVSGGTGILSIVNGMVGVVIVLAILVFLWRGRRGGRGGVPGFGKVRGAAATVARARQVTFADVAGEDEAKEQLTDIVGYLSQPEDYDRLGAHPPRGILLVGPPGTGKTLLAKAVAGEAGVPFFSIAASEFVEMYVGVGASRVRDLFAQAKKAESAIIFVDELDAVGRQRSAGQSNVHEEREQTLNQLLVELDGFDERDRVVVLAATNRPDVLDPALLRPGRFDRRVTVGLPDRTGREAILRAHARNVPCAPDVDLAAFAASTPGFAGADLANLINEAALLAARRHKSAVERADLDEALDLVLLGSAKPKLISPSERCLLAYHEAGHALVASAIPGADPVRKISIVPRGQALGVTVQFPIEDRFTYTRDDLIGRLAILFGGREAERLIFGRVSTGAEHDLKTATQLARRMVGLWGMSDEIGPYFLGTGEQQGFLRGESMAEQGISQALLSRAEAEIRHILDQSEAHAHALLASDRPLLDRLAEALLAEETLGPERVAELLAREPVGDVLQPA